MEWENILVICAILGPIFTYVGYLKGIKKEGEASGELKTDISYIKKNIETILVDQKNGLNEQKETNRNFNALSERVARIEEKVNAHLAIDSIKQIM